MNSQSNATLEQIRSSLKVAIDELSEAQDERRLHTRYPFNVPITLFRKADGGKMEETGKVWGLDVSTLGLGFFSRTPYSRNTEIYVDLEPLIRETTYIKLRVVHCTDPIDGIYRIGSFFSEIAAPQAVLVNMSEELFSRLKKSNKLPSPPGVALRILEIARSDDADLEDLVKVISSDPALASRILKFVNSPMGGASYPITSLDQAVNQMGFRGVQLMALSFSLIRSQKIEECPSFDMQRFWSRSLARAVAAKLIAKATRNRQDPSEAFIAGLLYRIGQLAFASSIPEDYEPVLKEASELGSDLRALERERLGADHVAVSSFLLKEWGLPTSLWRSTDATPDVADISDPNANPVLQVADLTASMLTDTPEKRAGKAEKVLQVVQEKWGMAPDAWTVFFDQIVQEWTVGGQLFTVEAGTSNSFAELQEEARDAITELSMATQMENIGIKDQNQQLLRKATTDQLTGIANRAMFDEILEEELERCRRDGLPLALLLLDIDHFKKVNNTYGHQAGDTVLKKVATALDNSVRKVDLLARYGGEEFAVIAPNCKTATASNLAERLRAAVEKLEGGEIANTITISIGASFALWPDQPKIAEEIIASADARLYEAKKAGRNCCRLDEFSAKSTVSE